MISYILNVLILRDQSAEQRARREPSECSGVPPHPLAPPPAPRRTCVDTLRFAVVVGGPCCRHCAPAAARKIGRNCLRFRFEFKNAERKRVRMPPLQHSLLYAAAAPTPLPCLGRDCCAGGLPEDAAWWRIPGTAWRVRGGGARSTEVGWEVGWEVVDVPLPGRARRVHGVCMACARRVGSRPLPALLAPRASIMGVDIYHSLLLS